MLMRDVNDVMTMISLKSGSPKHQLWEAFINMMTKWRKTPGSAWVRDLMLKEELWNTKKRSNYFVPLFKIRTRIKTKNHHSDFKQWRERLGYKKRGWKCSIRRRRFFHQIQQQAIECRVVEDGEEEIPGTQTRDVVTPCCCCCCCAAEVVVSIVVNATGAAVEAIAVTWPTELLPGLPAAPPLPLLIKVVNSAAVVVVPLCSK